MKLSRFSGSWPSIKDVAEELRLVNCNTEGECDVRLQVYSDCKWVIRSGLSDYDQSSEGYWGASSVPGVVDGRVMEFNAKTTARVLIEEAKEQYEQDRSLYI